MQFMVVKQSDEFKSWLHGLKDDAAKARIAARIKSVEVNGAAGLGDWKSVGGGIAEMRIKAGPGYRLYFRREGDVLIVLLIGGDKGSQGRDIARAKKIWKRWKESE